MFINFLCTMSVPSSTNLCIDSKSSFQHNDNHCNEHGYCLYSSENLVTRFQLLDNSITPWPCILAVTDFYCEGIPLNFNSSWCWWPRPCSTTMNWAIISMVHPNAKCTKFETATSNVRSSYVPVGKKSNWELISRKVDVLTIWKTKRIRFNNREKQLGVKL